MTAEESIASLRGMAAAAADTVAADPAVAAAEAEVAAAGDHINDLVRQYWDIARTRPDGRLLPRDRPGALVADGAAVAANAVRLAGSVDSVCVHGDSPGAVAAALAVRAALEAAGWSLRGLALPPQGAR